MASLTTKEEKELLFKELCTRLPHGVKVYGNYSYSDGEKIIDDKRVDTLDLSKLDWFINGIEIKPYLRPMSSMTEEDKKTLNNILKYQYYSDDSCMCEASDWLNANHFDYRGLIEKGLAIEVTEKNNPYKMIELWKNLKNLEDI